MDRKPDLDPAFATPAEEPASTTTPWQECPPVLAGERVVLRELLPGDASVLSALLTKEEVARFISDPPPTVDAFEQFITWAVSQRRAGRYMTFAVTLRGFDTAIGIFQLKQIEMGLGTAEWGFALGSPFWGTGVFKEAAEMVLAFAFDTVGIHRLEARAAIPNSRGKAALQKMGAVQEGILRRALFKAGQYLDQALYSIVDEEWRQSRLAAREDAKLLDPPVH